MRSKLHGRAGLALVLVVFGLTTGFLVQKVGCNQTSHYALVRALADGTARIDPWQETTCDKSYYRDHFYSNKAPGLAFVTLPFYLVLDELGGISEEPRTAIWALGLWGAVLPAVALLLLVRTAAERLEPGSGTLVALTFGLATLALPFSTVLFAHMLSALVLLAAFLLAWDGRRRADWRRTLLAGVLGGLAVVVEYPLGIVTVLLGVYVLAGPARLRSGALYGLGAILGAVPLAVYNRLAFGSITHLSYQNGVVTSGQSGHDVVRDDQVGGGTFFGIGSPSLDGLASVMASSRGLLVVTPILAVAVASLVLVWRRGHRAEAAFLGAAVLVVILWNAGFQPAFGHPLGGDVPGPRYLLPVLPFAVLPLALAYRVFPRTTALLAAVSAATMGLATVTQPMLGDDYTRAWIDFLVDGEFTNTVLTFGGLGHGWGAIWPALGGLAVLAAAGGALASWRDGEPWTLAIATLAGWAALATFVPNLVRESEKEASGAGPGLAAVAICALALALLGWMVATRASRARTGPPQLRVNGAPRGLQ